MHILFLTDNFPPETNAPASRTFEHAREWVAAGHKVTVITCAPNFPHGKVFNGYRNRLWQQEDMAGIRVIRVWSYMTGNEGFALRTLDFISFMFAGFIAALFVRKPDIIVGTSPQFFTVCAAYMAGTLKRVPWVFELRDIWPESIRTVGAIKESKVLDILERIEIFLYSRADRIVSVTRSFKRSLVSRGIPANKIDVVTNGVDLSRFAPRPKDDQLLHALQLPGKFIAGYIGTHGMAHGLDTLLDAAKLVAAQPGGHRFHFILLGDGANKTELVTRARAEQIENITFINSVSKDLVVKYWSLLDVSIIHLRKTPLFKTVIPSKLFECMAMGIPVLHCVKGESAAIVCDEDIGILVEPESAEDLARSLLRLERDKALHQRLAENGPQAAAKYDRGALATKMLGVLEDTANP